MQRTTILGLNRIRLFTYLKENIVLIAVVFLLILGILCGAVLYRNASATVNAFEGVFENYFSVRHSTAFFKVLFSSFITSVLIFGAIYISGTSIVGVVLAPSIVFIKGFEIGIFCSRLYTKYMLLGIAFNAIVYIPSSIVSLFCLILFTREATVFSYNLTRIFTPKGTTLPIYVQFKKYCKNFLIYISFIIISSLIDATVSLWIIPFFEF